MLFINEKESCQCTITYMVSAVNVFETTWSQDNENEVDLMKWVLSNARGNSTRDIREEKVTISFKKGWAYISLKCHLTNLRIGSLYSPLPLINVVWISEWYWNLLGTTLKGGEGIEK